MSAGEVKPTSQPVRTGITWTARISSIVIAGVLALQQAGVVTPQNAATIKTVTDQITPIAEKIEQSINDKKLPDAATIVDLATQVKKLVEQLQVNPKPAPTPIEPAPTPSPDQQRIADMEQQIKKLLDELAKKHEPPKPEPVPPASIKVVDSSGKPLADPIEAGKQFKVVASVAGKWAVTSESPTTDYDVMEYPDHLVCVLRNGAKLSISHATESPLTLTAIMVNCQDTGRPPPVDPEKPVVDDTKPNPVSTSAEWSTAIAKEAEVANASPAFAASEVLDGVLKFAVQDGMPKQIADSIRAAVPAIGASPARDLTPDEVEKIRGVK